MASAIRRSKSGGSGRGGIGINNTSDNSSSRNGREDTAKSTVAEHISQAVHSTSNLLHLMQLSSPSHAQLMKLPKNLLAKAPTIKNTSLALEQMPHVISSLDAHLETGLECLPHLKTVTQLLVNMESCQLNALSRTDLSQEEPGPLNKSSEAAN